MPYHGSSPVSHGSWEAHVANRSWDPGKNTSVPGWMRWMHCFRLVVALFASLLSWVIGGFIPVLADSLMQAVPTDYFLPSLSFSSPASFRLALSFCVFSFCVFSCYVFSFCVFSFCVFSPLTPAFILAWIPHAPLTCSMQVMSADTSAAPSLSAAPFCPSLLPARLSVCLPAWLSLSLFSPHGTGRPLPPLSDPTWTARHAMSSLLPRRCYCRRHQEDSVFGNDQGGRHS